MAALVLFHASSRCSRRWARVTPSRQPCCMPSSSRRHSRRGRCLTSARRRINWRRSQGCDSATAFHDLRVTLRWTDSAACLARANPMALMRVAGRHTPPARREPVTQCARSLCTAERRRRYASDPCSTAAGTPILRKGERRRRGGCTRKAHREVVPCPSRPALDRAGVRDCRLLARCRGEPRPWAPSGAEARDWKRLSNRVREERRGMCPSL